MQNCPPLYLQAFIVKGIVTRGGTEVDYIRIEGVIVPKLAAVGHKLLVEPSSSSNRPIKFSANFLLYAHSPGQILDSTRY